MSIRKTGETHFRATELLEEIVPLPLALHLSGSNIGTRLIISSLDLHTKKNCVQRQQKSRL